MTHTLGIPKELLSGEDHGGPKQKPEHTNLSKGADQQGLHPKDLDEQIGLNQRKHHIIYKVSSCEFAIPMEFTGNVMEMQLIPKEEILEELSRLREENAVTMKWIHIGTIEVVIKATFKEGIDSEIHLLIMDRRINNLRDGCLGSMIGNLYAGKLMFDSHPRIAYNLADQDFSRVLTLHQDFKRKDLMKEGKSISKFPEFSRNSLRTRKWKYDFGDKFPRRSQTMGKKRERQQGLIESDSFYKESEEEIENLSENPLAWWDRNKIEATLKIKEECKYEYVRYKPIQMNMEDKKDMQMIVKEHINLGLIEPGISAYSSPGFLATSNIIYRVVVPSRHIEKVIGRVGHRIQKTREDTEATIKIVDANFVSTPLWFILGLNTCHRDYIRFNPEHSLSMLISIASLLTVEVPMCYSL
ncbi:movement protein [Sesamum angolense]|uniref:Movement protein n=1 Tax=Sesamum angolense TaxID=2727404 RepID=A0AAE1WJI5_9LAMI|nr:movement protein [Sesamum angolense]